jgi:hypothetical protein
VHGDLWNYSVVETELTPFDACFFCLGVASAGMNEARCSGCRSRRRTRFGPVSSSAADAAGATSVSEHDRHHEQVGRAMLNVARRGWPTPILEQRDIAKASSYASA